MPCKVENLRGQENKATQTQGSQHARFATGRHLQVDGRLLEPTQKSKRRKQGHEPSISSMAQILKSLPQKLQQQALFCNGSTIHGHPRWHLQGGMAHTARTLTKQLHCAARSKCASTHEGLMRLPCQHRLRAFQKPQPVLFLHLLFPPKKLQRASGMRGKNHNDTSSFKPLVASCGSLLIGQAPCDHFPQALSIS